MIPQIPFNLSLLTDLYELTMMRGYFETRPDQQAVFEMFFRRQPFDGGYSIFAGLEPLIDIILQLRFGEAELQYLKSLQIFGDSFLAYLSKFRFSGDLWAMPEGSVVFPNEPLLRVRGNIIETQLLESIVLNMINFQTLIATKTARVAHAACGGAIIEFGLRRAHGVDGAVSATRAAFIGGTTATSNVLAGARYGIPVRGTMAHSWIMSFKNEEEAFRRYAELFPENCILLVDTYDTLKSGVPNAIRVLSELKDQGHPGYGIRLDSGDLEYLSRAAREMLDAAGLKEARILASNELDEWIINQIVKNNGPIDAWGVGSKIVTADKDPFLSGVYKLAAKTDAHDMQPVMKISNNPEKTTLPGIKNVLRFFNTEGMMLADLLYLEEEEEEILKAIDLYKSIRLHHPAIDSAGFTISGYAHARKLLTPVVQKGARCTDPPAIQSIRERAIRELGQLDQTYKRLINPHRYKVSISSRLKELKRKLIADYFNFESPGADDISGSLD
ncbi:MAG: nicotinate phosphoribosyltransferase [Pseudomonadota bacterium]